ncbi:MAG: DUF748 domain-containing protein [Alistipes sp.]|nr:DUF748 domain-containing protein [Candidatus Alistipes equi]
MKKSYKILIWIVAIFASIIILIALLISPIACNYINRHGLEMTGREIKIEKLRINIFTGRIEVNGLRIMESNGKETFLSVNNLVTKIKYWKLLHNKFIMQQLHLDTPSLEIFQKNSNFNFDDLLARFSSKDETSTKENEPKKNWDIGIYDIRLNNGDILYKDLVVGALWHPSNLNILIPGVYFEGGKSTDVGIVFNFSRGGSLETNLKYDMGSKQYDLSFKLGRMNISAILPYLQQWYNLSSIDGDLTANLTLKGETEHLLNIEASGEVTLARTTACIEPGDNFAHVDSLYINAQMLRFEDKTYRINDIYADGLRLAATIHKNQKNTFDDLQNVKRENVLLEEPTDSLSKQQSKDKLVVSDNEEIIPTDATVKHISMRNSEIHLKDESALRTFTYDITKIKADIKDFSLTSHTNMLDLRATMNKTGNIHLRWSGDVTSIMNHNIMLNCSNIKLSDFSTYCEQFTAYPITDGTLSFKSQNVISNGNLRGTNHLDMYKCTVDKKRKDVEPTVKIPLKLGLFILTDKTGHANIDLPVSGRIDSPSFSYRKIILKALGNVLLKVVTAPFSFLSGNKNLTEIPFNALEMGLTSEQYADLDTVADMILNREGIAIKLKPVFNWEKNIQALSESFLKLKYYAASRAEEDIKVDMLNLEEIRKIRLSDSGVQTVADTMLSEKEIDFSEMSIEKKARALFGEDSERRLIAMASMRAKIIMDYMYQKKLVPQDKFTIEEINLDELKAYNGKDRFTLSMLTDGEEINVDPEQGNVANTEQNASTQK